MPSKCKYVSPFCRKLSRGKSKNPCTKSVNGSTVNGTKIKGYLRPRQCSHPSISLIQSSARKSAAKTAARKRRSAIRTIQRSFKMLKKKRAKGSKGKSEGSSKGASKTTRSGRTVKARERLVEQ